MDWIMRMILPFRLMITAVEGTWKLNQNKTEAARLGVIAGLDENGQAGLAEAMWDVSKI